MSSKADRSLEGCCQWVLDTVGQTVERPISHCGSTPPSARLTKVSLDSAFRPVDHKDGLADRVVRTAGQAPAAPE